MSKIYVLQDLDYRNENRVIGVITSETILDKFLETDSRGTRKYGIFKLDDPELLNRIAKESENKTND